MPKRNPDNISGECLRAPFGELIKQISKKAVRCSYSIIAGSAGFFSTTRAFAQEENIIVGNAELLVRIPNSPESYEILVMAIYGGALSFALLSALWLIRQRGNMVSENKRFKHALADLRVSHDRNEALVNMPDHRIVVWNGIDEEAIVLGGLPQATGAPENPGHFLRFGQWIDQTSSQSFEESVTELRGNAIGFESVIKSRGGGVLEVSGSISGSYAVVKFRELRGVREELAQLKVEYENLSHSFNHVELLLAKLPMPFWLRDSAGALSWVNKAYADALEVADPKAVVDANMDLFDSEQREILEKPGDDGELLDELLPATVAGDRRKLRVLSVGAETGFAGIAVDKSDMEDVRRVLKETNDGHSRMLDQMATAVAIFDKSQRLIFHNNSFQQLWQLDPGKLEGNPSNGDVLDAMRDGKLLPEHPDWRKWRQSQLAIYTALEPVEEWWHLLDGQTIRVVVTPRSPGGSTWIFENVTERLALESNYNALMRIQGETLDHLNEAVAVFGSNGQLKLFNPALEELWQNAEITAQEGLHVSRIIEKWSASVGNTEILQQILGSVTGFDDARNSLDGRMELLDGRSVQYTLVPLPDGQTMLTFVDVTANVNFERALRERAEALEASDLLKGKFIQHVSYELRAPLTSISGFGEILKMGDVGELNQKQTEYLSHINASASVLRNLVDDILDLASIDAGTLKLDVEPVDLDATVKSAFDVHVEEMHEKGLRSEVDIEKASETVMGDADRLLQVVGNLVSNAINFSPDGGTINVATTRVGKFHEIRVMDEGKGIEPSEFEVIFDRFETQPTASGKKGTGLGLSIVRGFMELHGGSASIDANYKKGTCFVCKLPVKPKEISPSSHQQTGQLASVA